jgi:myosin heavy subunit
MKKKIEKKSEEVNDIREMYNERIRNIEKARTEIDTMNEKKEEIAKEVEKKAEEDPISNSENFVDYSAISKKGKKSKKGNSPIKIISESEAQQYSKDYELIGLSLYEDDVLIDDETENIISPSEMTYWIGENGIENIRNSFESNGGTYILNETRKAIYDITLLDERFGDDYEPVTIE